MSELYENNDNYPHLNLWELKKLAERAKLIGDIKNVDYPDEQLQTEAQPYSYVLSIDAEPFEVLVEEWRRRGFETVTTAEIEYTEARVLDTGEPLVPPIVYVSISSIIYHPPDPRFFIMKDTVYMLPLVSHGKGVVKEAYSENGPSLYELFEGDRRRILEMRAGEMRHLTQDDIDLLRILLSYD